MKKLLSILVLLLAFDVNAQLVPRQTVEPGAGLVFCTSTDLTDAYTCPTATPIITALTPNLPVLLTVATSNIGAATLVVRNIGSPITILAHDGTTLTNNAITAGRPYLLIYNGTNFLLYAVGSVGGAGLSGLTNNRVLKASGSTNAQDSSCIDTGTSIDCGDLTGNYHQEDFETPTAAPHVHTWPAATGRIAQTTGTLTTGDFTKFDSSGRLVRGGSAIKTVQMEIFGPTTATATGDGKAYFRVPTSLNGMNLVAVNANVIAAGTTNLLNVDIARCAATTAGAICTGTGTSIVDMLTTNLTIDSGENDSSTAATPVVITTNSTDMQVSTGQVLRIDIDAIHTTPATGLILNMEFSLP